MVQDDFFADFPPVSKADWLAQIARDLKEQPLAHLEWRLDASLTVSPFVHPDDGLGELAPLWAAPKNWEIMEDVVVEDAARDNRTILDALEGGATGIHLIWPEAPDNAAFETLMRGVYPDFIGLHFSGRGVQQNPGMVFHVLQHLVQQRQLSTKSLSGSVLYQPSLPGALPDWRYLSELLTFVQQDFPAFRIICLQSDASSTADQLAAILQQASDVLRALTDRGLSAAQVARSIFVRVHCGKSYFLEIARLRALHLLWFNLLESWQVPPEAPCIHAGLLATEYTDDLYTNMIRGATMAMSAVMGGADQLCVLPYDAGRASLSKYPPAFGRRIARNVQHLLKMESKLDAVADPAAGSYYIEQLTRQLATQAWEKFIEQQG